MANNEKEIWRAHPGIGIIEVSTLGKVRTINRMGSRENRTRLKKGHILNQYENAGGYLHVSFRMNGKLVNKYVHRLVAEAFIPNPEKLPQVNHKDCDITNNNVDNLEFCTASYNAKYREKFGISTTESQGHHVFAIDLKMLEVSKFRSQGEASRKLGVNQGNIYSVIKGSRKQAGGFWFVNDNDNADDVIKRKLHTLQSQVLGL